MIYMERHYPSLKMHKSNEKVHNGAKNKEASEQEN